MARLFVAACLCALVSYAAAAGMGSAGSTGNRPTAYEQLTAVKGQWTITMEATKGDDKTVFAPQVCDKPLISAPCNQPLLSADSNDKIRVVATHAAPLKVVDGLAPENVVMRLCFAKPFVVDRPWRKPGDVIDKDKACPQVIGTVPISATNNTYTATWAVTKSTPKATWYAQVFVECKNGTATGFCQYDTSVNQTYVGTQIIESTPVSMKVAVALCSAIAPVFLAAFFIKEQVLKKKA